MSTWTAAVVSGRGWRSQGQSAHLGSMVPRLGSCGSSARARRLCAARYPQGEAPATATGIPATASAARASPPAKGVRRFHCVSASRGGGGAEQTLPLHYRYITVTLPLDFR